MLATHSESANNWRQQLETNEFFVAKNLIPRSLIDNLRLRAVGTLFRTSNTYREQVKSNGFHD